MSVMSAVSLLIPTMNRADFLERLLWYYVRGRCPSPILIGDSSHDDELERTRRLVASLQDRLTVQHVACPGLNNYEVMEQLLTLVTTPYATYLADDDFLVMRTVGQCVTFLDAHPDYSAAGGTSILFSLDSSGPYGRMTFAWSNTMHAFEHGRARDRFLDISTRRYVPAFVNVCRTEVLCRAMERMGAFRASALPHDQTWWSAEAFSELLASCAVVIQGKVKTLEGLYWVRQAHDRRYVFPDIFDWVTSANWRACYAHFRQRITELLTSGAAGAQEDHDAVCKQGLWGYLAKACAAQYHGHFPTTNRRRAARLKAALKRAPGVYSLWRTIWNYWPGESSSVSLSRLLRSRSSYYRDFQPVYELVTQRPPHNLIDGQEALFPVAAGVSSNEYSCQPK